MVQAKTAVGDIDNNGDMEIVISARNGYVYVYNHDGTAFSGWPQNANGVLGFISPTLFDLDRDGDLEIIMVQMQSGQPGHVYVWHHNGTVYPGWPQNMDYLGVATAAVADIDNDSLFEIIALSYYSVYAWDQNGNTEPGWPKLNVAGGMSYAQPVLADLDANGDLEVLHSYYSGGQNYVGIYHHDGTTYSGWPQTFPGPQTYTTPVTADIDEDGDLEIFNGGHYIGAPDLLARHHGGSQVPGWPVTCEMLECSPVILDVENNNDREVVIADNVNPGNLFAYNGNGSPVTDWPAATTAAAGPNSAAAGDVDLDGDLEIALVVMDGSVNLWTLDGIPFRGYMTEWGTFFHDIWNTGWFHPEAPQNLNAAGFPTYIGLAWRKNTEPDIAGYVVYRSETPGGPYSRINQLLVPDTVYADTTALPGITYNYCVTAQIKALAESRLSNESSAQLGISEVQAGDRTGVSISPNPFTNAIRFAANDKSMVTVRIFNAQGRLIDELTGAPRIEYRPSKSLSAGIYFVELRTGSVHTLKKIVKIN
jgi:hypothetical protein